MNRATQELVSALPCNELDVIEISGTQWEQEELGFRSYRTVDFPQYDICAGPLGEAICDLVIAEQVFEHIERPHLAARNVYAMLRPKGALLITTPFLVKYHAFPRDLYRWTEDGLRVLLEDSGFGEVVTGSWGNSCCLRADMSADLKWTMYHPLLHSLHNEPQFPVSVWAMGKKSC
jgi:SAM-dependent methyltransferase